MISLVRSKVWFPGFDKQIEKTVQACETCALFGNNPGKNPTPSWKEPEKRQRIHMDFCESQGGQMWLVVIDAKSKWLEVKPMRSTTTERIV